MNCGVFGGRTDGLWAHRHGSILQEAELLENLPKYAASPLKNKPFSKDALDLGEGFFDGI
jgi:hypothetical protein